MDFGIRPVTNADEQVILDIFNYFVESSFAAYTEHPEGPAFFRKLREISSGYPFYIAENRDRQAVGFALMHPYYGMNVFRRSARITYFILPEYTRFGLGSMFLDRLIGDAKKIGIDNILASISSLNEQSLNFHRKHGFVECGRFKSVGIKWAREFDEIWMQLSLKEQE